MESPLLERETRVDPAIRLRRAPTQARAKRTFDRILVAAAQMLEEEGVGGFTTNRLAERAGVGLQALYRYFPNKEAVVCTLAARMFDAWSATFSDFEAALDEHDGDWPSVWSEFVDRYVASVRLAPGAAAIRSAMSASPRLREIDEADSARVAQNVAGALLRWRPALGRARASAAARTLIETAGSLTDQALLAKPAESRRLVDELKAMQGAYLRTLMEEES